MITRGSSPQSEASVNLRVQKGVKMKSVTLKAYIYLKIFVYFFESLFLYLAEPVRRIFGPDDNSYPEIGVQPYGGDYYSKWE